MTILFDCIWLQLVYIQYVHYFFKWMICMTPMCHQVWYQKLCPPFVGMTKEPFFPRLFSTSQKKARAYWTWRMNTAINDQGWEGDSSSHYVCLMNTHKLCYSFCIFSVCIITIYTYFILLILNYFNLYYFNFYNLTFFQTRYQLFLSCAWK